MGAWGGFVGSIASGGSGPWNIGKTHEKIVKIPTLERDRGYEYN